MIDVLIIGGELLIAASIAFLALMVRRDRQERMERDARQARLFRDAQEQSLRIAMLGRRMPVQERIDALWFCWARGGRPEAELIAAAAAAIEEAKLVYPPELAPDLDEAARLLLDFLRHAQWQQQTLARGRHSERIELMEREAELEKLLKPKIAGLRALLAEAMRVPDLSRAG